jgi:hypothetical protein
MTRARAITTAANRRLWLDAIVRSAGRSLTLAAAGGLALVAVDRLLGIGLPVWTLLSAPILVGCVGAGFLAARERRRAGDASIVLDHALGLRDRVSSSIALERVASNGDANDPFLALAREDAERVSSDANVRRAIPIRFDNWWVAAPFAAAALVTASLFTPVFDVFGASERRVERVALEERRERSQEVIDEIKEELRQATANQSADAATPEQLRALEELERELAQGEISPDDARTKAASRLDDLAQSFEDRAEREDRTLDALGEKFASLDGRASDDSAAKPLEDALRRGDWGAAAEALEQLRRETASDSSISPEEREQVARDLDDLARAIEQAAGPEQQAQGGADQPGTHDEAGDPERPEDGGAFDQLREQGVPSDVARDLAESRDAQEISDALQREGLAPEQAERLADRIAQENERRGSEEQAQRDLRDLAKALDDAAENARNPDAPPSPPPTPSPTQTPPTDPNRPSANEQRREQEGPPQEQRTPSGGENRPRNENDPSSRESEKDPGAPQRNPQQGPSQDVGTDQGDEQTSPNSDQRGRQVDDAQRPDAQPQPGTQDQQGSSKDDASSPSNQEAPDGAQQSRRDASGRGAGQEGESQRPGANADQRAEDGAQSGARDSGTSEGDRSGQGESNNGMSRALDKVRELAQRRDIANQSREDAQRLREQAERMMQDLSPEEREQMRRLAEQIAREQGAPVEDFSGALSRDVDARRPTGAPDDSGRVIAEWLSDGKPGANDARGTVDARRRLTEAAAGAQRAIEEQQTPARHSEFIRRYFQRLPGAVDRAAPSNAPPVRDAQDVAPQGAGG